MSKEKENAESQKEEKSKKGQPEEKQKKSGGEDKEHKEARDEKAGKKADGKQKQDKKGGDKPEKEGPPLSKDYVPRLKKTYYSDTIKKLMEQYKYTTPMAIPRVVKIIINVGAGDAVQDKAVLDPVVEEMSMIAAQRAVKTYAKKSISNFHLREGMPIGARVTLRGPRMYDFLDKLISIALPRVRDFKGLSRSSFDGRGNYTFSLKEQLVFPEIDYDKIKKIRGMDITIVTTAKDDEEAYSLLKTMGFPLKEK